MVRVCRPAGSVMESRNLTGWLFDCRCEYVKSASLPLPSTTAVWNPWQSKKNWVRSGRVITQARGLGSLPFGEQSASCCKNRWIPGGLCQVTPSEPSTNRWLVPSPSVSVTVVGCGRGWKSSGVPSRWTVDACSDQPNPIDESEVSSEL